MNIVMKPRYEYRPVYGGFWTTIEKEPTIRRSKRGQRAAEAKKWWVRR